MQHSDIISLFVILGVMLVTARTLGEIARKLGQPAVFGEILAGVLLGPTVLGAFFPELDAWLVPRSGNVATFLSGFYAVSVALFLLGAGMEVNLGAVVRQGKEALSLSLSGIVFPFALGFASAWYFPRLLGSEAHTSELVFALFFATALSISALPVIAKTLMDLNLLRTDLGMLIIVAAIFDDLVGWTIFSILLGMIGAAHTGRPIWETVVMALMFAGAALTVVRWLMNRILPWILAYTSWPGGVLSFSIAMALLSAALMEWVGVHAIFGAFLAGVVVGDSHHMREQTRSNIDQFVSNIFAPIFFASLGLKVNFIARFDPLVVGVVVVIACVGKVVGCRIGGWLARVPNRQAWALGFGMNSRGAVEIVLASLALQADLIRERLFVALVVMALFTSMISGPLMKWILKRPSARRLEGFVAARTFRGALAARVSVDAIAELALPASEAAGLPALVVKNAVLAREELMSTALGDGVAVPHARLEGLAKPVVAVGLAPEGVNWNAADGQPARLVVLLLTPENDEGAQLELISDVARTFRSAAMREAALKTQSYTEFLALIRTGTP